MKNRKPAKLKLNRETLRSLEDSSLLEAVGGLGGGNLSIPVCTRAISDCISCTRRPDVCPVDPTTGTIA
ncbi:MAG: hypothetical protein WAM82_17640 [Thermoanaerobaculia bacterium]